jgi:TIR domain
VSVQRNAETSPDGYAFDVFLSYRRSGPGNSGQWVRNHFHPLLRDCLADQLGWAPRVFLDVETETGTIWPDHLEHALLRSRMLVCVWTPPYFRSPWCLAEWETMQARERLLDGRLDCALVYPVVFSDSDSFPPAARSRQARDLKPWSNPFPAFRDSRDYDDLYKEMTGIAIELAGMLPRTPPWTDGWPVCRPAAPTPPPPDLPMLRPDAT